MSFGNSAGKALRPACSTLRKRKLRGVPGLWGSEWDCTRATTWPNVYMSRGAMYRMAGALRTRIITWRRAQALSSTTTWSCISRNNYVQSDADSLDPQNDRDFLVSRARQPGRVVPWSRRHQILDIIDGADSTARSAACEFNAAAAQAKSSCCSSGHPCSSP